jgi:transcription elongation factor SPT5
VSTVGRLTHVLFRLIHGIFDSFCIYLSIYKNSARGGKFFRPGKSFRPDAGDDEDDSDEDSSDEEEEEPPKVAAKAKNNANLSSDDSDDEDGDDDDDDGDNEDGEEEEEDTRNKRKKTPSSAQPKSKKPKLSSFFDEEAEDDDDEDDEGDEEAYGTHHDPDDIVKKHYTEEDIRKEQMDDEAQELIRAQDRRRAQAGHRFGKDEENENERSVQEMARDIEERHKMSRRQVDRSVLDRHPNQQVQHHRAAVEEDDAPGGPEVYSAVSQQSLVPSVSDPSLWMISCSTGKEQELVFQIMNKCVAFARQGRPLGICGAIAAQSKGKIYIESYSEPAVVEAIQAIRGLLQYTMKLVPIQDMTTVMTVVPTKKPGMLCYFILCYVISCYVIFGRIGCNSHIIKINRADTLVSFSLLLQSKRMNGFECQEVITRQIWPWSLRFVNRVSNASSSAFRVWI